MNETQRLQALREYRILDTEPEAAFDRLTAIAAAHYDVPIALISLVDESRQWFKSRLGLDVCQTPREISFCTHAIRTDQPLIVNDASSHRGFADNPLVTGPPHIRFYAGCPLIAASGARIGTLCIIDHEPRPDFNVESSDVLRSLAALVVDEMELRLARERAEAESRAKSDFIATMSHELRTPMTSVMGYIELLAETKLDEHQSECVRLVRNSSAHLLELLNDALDLSKIEAGRLKLRPEDFFPAELVEHAVELFAESARSRGLNLFVDISPPATTSFRGDRTRIQQILFNLMNNAIKFTDDGEVSVSCEVKPDDEGMPTLYLSVRDTGIGIPADMHAILFDRFVQGDGRDTREHYGAGLGLAICRELAEVMGGTITAENCSAGGSCFRAVIPAQNGGA
ncbi:MAG: ATP-binding protein [Gammaproteobacteria bacterium]|nr:ATP-binding protein [Gammaproteobacteria bacterium]